MSQPLVPGGSKTSAAYDEMQIRRATRKRKREVRAKAEALGLHITSSGQVVTDVPCPNDGEFTNIACWKCGWQRDPEERKATILKAQQSGLLPAWAL